MTTKGGLNESLIIARGNGARGYRGEHAGPGCRGPEVMDPRQQQLAAR